MFTIDIEEIYEILIGDSPDFPKYTTQIMNLANQNAQGTRPSVVGQMSDLMVECPHNEYKKWRKWYLSGHPGAIDTATERIWDMIKKLREAIDKIDKDMIRSWVDDLVINKSFIGIRFQEIILNRVASRLNTTYRMATKNEESAGIDGYIDDRKVQIKPITYRSDIYGECDTVIIYYEKKRDRIEVDDSRF